MIHLECLKLYECVCLLCLCSAEAAVGRHAAGTRQGSAGVRSAALRSRIPLSETRSPRAEGDQIQSVRRHQHGADLALQE